MQHKVLSNEKKEVGEIKEKLKREFRGYIHSTEIEKLILKLENLIQKVLEEKKLIKKEREVLESKEKEIKREIEKIKIQKKKIDEEIKFIEELWGKIQGIIKEKLDELDNIEDKIKIEKLRKELNSLTEYNAG